MKKLPKNRLTDVSHLRRFDPRLLARFIGSFKGLNLHLPENPTDKNMPYEKFRRACFCVDDSTPPEFLVASHLISASVTPSQRQRIEAILARQKPDLKIPADVSDHDFALLIWFEDPGILEAALYYAVMKRQRKYTYYPPAAGISGPPRKLTAAARRHFEEELNLAFRNKGYGIGARIIVDETPDELSLLIRRGEHIARVAAVANDGDGEIHVLRPENYDVAIVNKRFAFLKILSKPDNQTLHPYYRALLGELLYGNGSAFLERQCFHIHKFCAANREVIAPTGCEKVLNTALVGVYYEFPGAKKSSCRLKAPDIYAMRGPGVPAIPPLTIPKDVTVKVEFRGEAPAVDVKVFDGNVITFSRETDASIVDDWMIQRGILMLQEPEHDEKIA